jgi:hypothetical protein
MTKPNPVVGQTLYSLNVCNAARNREQVLAPVIVTKVGRKYFTAQPEGKSYGARDYHLGSWRQKTEYSPDSELYADPKEWEDEKTAYDITGRIRQEFSHYSKPSQTLDQLRRIAAILDESNQPTPCQT